MTATLVALFVEKGDLKWDDTLAKVFPELAEAMSPQVRKITLEQLLTHHAGLKPNVGLGLLFIPSKLSPRQQRQEVLKGIVSEKLDAEPASKFQYSNVGYILAGHMVEKVANSDWEEVITKKLFQPLGMKTAGFGPMGTAGKVDQPWQHKADGTPIEPGPNKDNHVVMGPAGRVHCSLPDWARFIALQLRAGTGQPTLLKPETFKLLHDTPFPYKAYCLGGWGRTAKNKDTEGMVLTHDGSNNQNHCTAWLALERGFAVLVAANQGGDPGNEACTAARKELVRRFLPGR
jgi:CubicO group peptidase (beta-lactamase class C family)